MSRASKLLALTGLVLVALVAARAAYAWSAVKYADDAAVISWDGRITDGFAYREFNRVWRPLGKRFCLFYNGVDREVCNASENPFTDTRNAYARAVCFNDEATTVYHVTCLTTRP